MIDFADHIQERQEVVAAMRSKVDDMVREIIDGRRRFPTSADIQEAAFEVGMPFVVRRVVQRVLMEHGLA